VKVTNFMVEQCTICCFWSSRPPILWCLHR